jgi:hypothetical protein
VSPALRIAMVFALCGGCVTIRSDVRIIDYPEGTRHVDRVVQGSRVYRAAAEIDDDNLVVKLTRVEACEEADVPLLRRKRVTSKTEVPSLLGIHAEWAAGVGGLGLGGLTLLDPERACSQTAQDGTSSMTDPQTCVALGWSLVGLGAVLTTIAIVDSIRVTDEEQDLGTHEGEYVASTRACHAGPVIDTAVELRLGRAAASRPAQTSRLGEVVFSMFDVEGDALPSPGHPVSIAIGGEVVPVELTDPQYQVLVHNLRNNPHSRLAARDIELARSACDAQVDGAAQLQVKPDSGDTEIAAARDAWQHAKLACRAQWSTGHQQRLDAVETVITDSRIGAALLALRSGDLDRLDAVLSDDPAAVERFRDDPDLLQPLRKMVAEPARVLVSGRSESASAERRLCRARSIFVRLRGQQAWDQLKVEVARNISELGGGMPSNIVRIMDAAHCD